MDNYEQDKQEAVEWAQKLLEKDKWCIIDTETTGLENAQICQLGVLTPGDGWQTLVKPELRISNAAFGIHGIHDLDVENSPDFTQVFWELMRRAGDKDIVIYNTGFDLQAIRNSLKAHGIQIAFPTSDRRQCRIFTNGGCIHDAMLWYSQWVGEWNDYHGNYKWQKLPGGDHSALGDCRATLEIIRHMAGEEWFAEKFGQINR